MKKFILIDTFSIDGYYLTQEYGTNKYFDYTKYGLLYHEGTDLGHTNKSKPVRCVNGGQCLIGKSTSYGNYVIVIDYNQLCATYYCHLNYATVVQGEEVEAGDKIGIMGKTGNSTGEHVHLNFVIVDNSGSRLYNTKTSNYGYLDPQHPLDPNETKYPPGVEEYQIDWVKKKENEMPNLSDEIIGKSTQRDELVQEYNLKIGTADKKELLNAVNEKIAKVQREKDDCESDKKKNYVEKSKFEDLKGELESLKTRCDQEEDEKKDWKNKYNDLIEEIAKKLSAEKTKPSIFEEITKLIDSEDKLRKLTKEHKKLNEDYEKLKDDNTVEKIITNETHTHPEFVYKIGFATKKDRG